MKLFTSVFTSLILIVSASIAYSAPIKVLAAENFYGSLAKEIGGKYVSVNSIINNPDADPHLFSTSVQTAKDVTDAQIIIYNGADYDPWMAQMLASQSSNNKLAIINVAELIGVKSGENPHIWYKPETFPTLAKRLTLLFSQLEPQHKTDFESNLNKFDQNYQKVYQLIDTITKQYKNIHVSATEPVYGYMADALGFKMEGLDFQWLTMNDSEPSPKVMSTFTAMILKKNIRIMYENGQVNNPNVQTVLKLAKRNNIPVVQVSETLPKGISTTTWIENSLQQTLDALKK